MRLFSRRIYLDYAGATPILKSAERAMHSASQLVGNPGAIHQEALEAKRALESAREKIAHEIGCKAREVIFVSGGTEANNLAILGFARAYIRRLNLRNGGLTSGLSGTHWIVSSIEHPSVLECFGEVERLGGKVTFADPDPSGIVQATTIARHLKPDTVFVSVGWVNGEIGTIQPLADIRAVIRAHEEKNGTTVILHSDAGQGPLYRASHVHTLGVDLFSLDAAKLYGPRGTGALYVSNRVELSAIMLGGKQERGLRAGTENVALAAGFAYALQEVRKERDQEAERLRGIRDTFAENIAQSIPDVVFNGDLRHATPHILNISIPDINSEYLVLSLDHNGVALSTKSACREGQESCSHVVEALGDAITESAVALSQEERARNTLRISLGRDTTSRDLAKALHILIGCLESSKDGIV